VSDELWIERGTEQNMKENKHTTIFYFFEATIFYLEFGFYDFG
jgi:hypothetical protein